MKVLIDVIPAELPAPFQVLLDPEQPLAHPDRFAPWPRDGGWLSWLILLLCIVGAGLLAAGIGREAMAMSAGRSYSAANLGLGVFLTLPLLWWGVRQVGRIRVGRAQARAMAAGRYRRGVFFESSAALSFDGRTCTLMPRGNVVRIDRRPAANVDSGAQAMGTYIVFKGPGGAERSRWVPGAGWDSKARMWLQSGKLPG